MPETARSKPLEIWFQDEARVGQQGTLTRIWAERGTRPRAPRDTRYIWSYIFGAVCPERAEAAALIMPHADTQAMSAHLAGIAKTVASGAHALLILDGAGWHGSAELEVPDNITLLKLPPYSPELNPMENVWAYLRANKLAISVFDNYEQIVDPALPNFRADRQRRGRSLAGERAGRRDVCQRRAEAASVFSSGTHGQQPTVALTADATDLLRMG